MHSENDGVALVPIGIVGMASMTGSQFALRERF